MPSLASSTVNTSSVKSVIKSVDKLASYCYAGRSALPVPRVASVTCRARAESSVTEAIKIDGIRRSYCNEFVCTSSPAMEETVRVRGARESDHVAQIVSRRRHGGEPFNGLSRRRLQEISQKNFRSRLRDSLQRFDTRTDCCEHGARMG